MRKLIGVLTILTIVVTGCYKEPAEQPAPVEYKPVVEEPVAEEPSVMDRFGELLVPESSAADLGRYITEHISEVTSEEAEKMIEWLIIYQTEITNKMNTIIYREDYINALNNNMEGILNPELVNTIDNEQVKQDFKDLIDGYLTIVRQEVTPCVETDWAKIAKLSQYFSDDFANMTIYFDRIQNNAYGTWDKDFGALYDAAVYVENLALHHERSFLTWQLNRLYRRQIFNLLIGDECLYIGSLIQKSGEPYESLIAGIERYPESRLSELVEDLVNYTSQDFMVFVDRIGMHAVFGIGSMNSLAYQKLDEINGTNEIIQVNLPENNELEVKINNRIKESILSMIEEADNSEVSIRSDIGYANDVFFRLNISVSYTDASGEFQYESKSMTIDMSTGELMNFSDYLGMPFEDFNDILEELAGITFDQMPQMSIVSNGISLVGQDDEQAHASYVFLSFKQLAPYINYEQYFK